MKSNYDVVVFIGRVNPPHVGHMATIEKAFEYTDNVIVVLGSANTPRTFKNPFTERERSQMIVNSLPPHLQTRVRFVGAEDYLYSDTQWLTEITQKIRSVAKEVSRKEKPSIALIAHKKDDTTYYVDYFKFLDAIIPVDEFKVGGDDSPALSATKIRELYFEGYLDFIKHVCPQGVYEFMNEFTQLPEYQLLKDEYDDAVEYERKFETAPYGYTNFLTVDSVVFQSGHILLVKRKYNPGAGLWALPGGHLGVDETFQQGAIRELKEETSIKVPDKVLKGSIFAEHIFDHPDRSLRCRVKGKKGRTVTMAFGFKLDDSESLPKVKGADDAEIAYWLPIDKVLAEMRGELFEDHLFIIEWFANRL